MISLAKSAGFQSKVLLPSSYIHIIRILGGTTHLKKVLWKIADLFLERAVPRSSFKVGMKGSEGGIPSFFISPKKNQKHQQWKRDVSNSVILFWAGNPLSGVPSFEQVGGYFCTPLFPRIGMVDIGLILPCPSTLWHFVLQMARFEPIGGS